MKRLISIFIVAVCATTSVSWGAVNIKKAAPVATKKTEAVESATSLLPTVIGLVGSVQALSAQQQQLSADCAPTSDELNTVNDLVKEWAKLGETTAASAASGLGVECTSYQSFMDLADSDETCYEYFSGTSNEGTVWDKFPKATSAKICEESGGSSLFNKSGSGNCKTVSNIYDIFGRLPFTDDDYTKSEAKKIAALKEKAQKCAPAKIAAAKRELYGGFLTQTLSSVGQSTGAAGTSSVLDAVSSMGGSGDIKSILPSLGTMATQMLDK